MKVRTSGERKVVFDIDDVCFVDRPMYRHASGKLKYKLEIFFKNGHKLEDHYEIETDFFESLFYKDYCAIIKIMEKENFKPLSDFHETKTPEEPSESSKPHDDN